MMMIITELKPQNWYRPEFPQVEKVKRLFKPSQESRLFP